MATTVAGDDPDTAAKSAHARTPASSTTASTKNCSRYPTSLKYSPGILRVPRVGLA